MDHWKLIKPLNDTLPPYLTLMRAFGGRVGFIVDGICHIGGGVVCVGGIVEAGCGGGVVVVVGGGGFDVDLDCCVSVLVSCSENQFSDLLTPRTFPDFVEPKLRFKLKLEKSGFVLFRIHLRMKKN